MSESCICTLWRSPLGWMALASGPRGLLAVTAPRPSREQARAALRTWVGAAISGEDENLRATCRELDRYFSGDRAADFGGLVLDWEQGTPFQRQVWREVYRIPFGETRTYRQIAAAVGRPAAVRAVGQCNARNPWAIVVPCHRVIGSDAGLTGYAGGVAVKKSLLELEGIPVTAHYAKMLAAAVQRRDIDANRN